MAKKAKTKVIIKTIKARPSIDEMKLKAEIEELHKKKEGAGFISKLALNKAINERRAILKKNIQISGLKQQKEIAILQREISKEKSEMQELKKKRSHPLISEEDIFGTKELFKI